MPIERSPLFGVQRRRRKILALKSTIDWAERKVERLYKRNVRDKCLHALKRRHWMSMADEIQYGDHGYKCFGEYPLKDPSLLCHSYLKAGEVGCEACVIVTKLLEVLDE